MTCAFVLERPEPFNRLGSGCQFPDEPLIEFEGKDWCRFHLPMDTKENWSDADTENFYSVIFQRIEAARDSGADVVADLSGVVFPPRAIFTRFKQGPRLKNILFVSARFPYGTYFSGVSFADSATFERATFEGWTLFDDTIFGRRADFRSAIFGDWVTFRSATFGDWAKFNGAKFAADADFSASAEAHDKSSGQDFGVISFDQVIFHGSVRFTNRKFREPATYRGATFQEAPEFHGAELHQGIVFPGIEGFPDTASPGAAAAYCTLKLAMERLRSREEQAVFHALEQRSRRREFPWWRAARWFSLLYDVTADYGCSIGRPLALLGLTTTVAWEIYMGVALACESVAPAEAFRFTFEQLARPFFIWSPSYGGTGWVQEALEHCPFLLRGIATLQSLASLGLIALFLLALRRRFKMD